MDKEKLLTRDQKRFWGILARKSLYDACMVKAQAIYDITHHDDFTYLSDHLDIIEERLNEIGWTGDELAKELQSLYPNSESIQKIMKDEMIQIYVNDLIRREIKCQK